MTMFQSVRIFIAGMIAIGLTISAQAQDWDCEDAGNLPQQGMNYCAFQDWQAADLELNAVYKEVRATLRSWDSDLPSDLRGAEQALLNAQRAWITYRDNHCEAEGFIARGGTLEPLLVSSCKAHETRERTKVLLQLIETF